MLRTDEILSTIQMLHAEHLDVRSVTLGLNLDDCAAPSLDHLCRKLRQKIASRASRLVEVCDRVGGQVRHSRDQQAAGHLAGRHAAGRPRPGGGRATGQDARRGGRRVPRRLRGRLHGPGPQGDLARRRGGDGVAAGGACRRPGGSAPRSTWPRGGRASTWTPSSEMGHILLQIAAATADQQRLRLRQAGGLRQHPRGQPLHGRGLPGRRRAGGRGQHRRLRAGRGLQRLAAAAGHGRASSRWATWPRRSRSPASASRAWAS